MITTLQCSKGFSACFHHHEQGILRSSAFESDHELGFNCPDWAALMRTSLQTVGHYLSKNYSVSIPWLGVWSVLYKSTSVPPSKWMAFSACSVCSYCTSSGFYLLLCSSLSQDETKGASDCSITCCNGQPAS